MTNDNQDALRRADELEAFPHVLLTVRRPAAAHLRRLVAQNEAKDALLQKAVEALESGYWKQKAVNAIRQHLEGRA